MVQSRSRRRVARMCSNAGPQTPGVPPVDFFLQIAKTAPTASEDGSKNRDNQVALNCMGALQIKRDRGTRPFLISAQCCLRCAALDLSPARRRVRGWGIRNSIVKRPKTPESYSLSADGKGPKKWSNNENNKNVVILTIKRTMMVVRMKRIAIAKRIRRRRRRICEGILMKSDKNDTGKHGSHNNDKYYHDGSGTCVVPMIAAGARGPRRPPKLRRLPKRL